jgi:hypothetical protein
MSRTPSLAEARKAAERAGAEQQKSAGTPIPSCDKGIFRGLLGDIAEIADPGTEADKVGVYASLLSATSALIQSPFVRIGNTQHPLLVWSLLIGRTNTGRKGEATATAMRVVREGSEVIAEITESGLSSGEGVIERIRDVRDEEDDGGTEDKRLLVIEPEFVAVMEACRREGNRLPGILREAWGGGRLSSLTKKRVGASRSHIAIIGHITPREFRLKVREADLAGGTYNRFLPFYVERRKLLPLPPGFDAEQLTTLAKRYQTAIARAGWRKEVGLDEDAQTLWCDKLYSEFTELDDDGAVADFIQRAAPYCRRVAGLYAVLDERSTVNKGDLEASAYLVRYAIASARFILDPAPRDVRLDKLRRAVDEAGEDGLALDQISELFGRHLPKEDREELITKLLGDSAYTRRQVPTGGRPKQVLLRARKARKAS